jgi:hypothetical protein
MNIKTDTVAMTWVLFIYRMVYTIIYPCRKKESLSFFFRGIFRLGLGSRDLLVCGKRPDGSPRPWPNFPSFRHLP